MKNESENRHTYDTEESSDEETDDRDTNETIEEEVRGRNQKK